MARVATKMNPTKGGGFIARKRIPEDAQADYERLYSVRWEARLSIDPGTPVLLARAKHREWLSEIESRIIRAEKKGEGRSLTPKEARALAGEWYHWFTERHLRSARSPTYWEDYRREEIAETLRDELGLGSAGDLDDLWERSPEIREDVRPMLADWGEVAQFLHTKRLVLDEHSRKLFLDNLYGDFAAALDLLEKRARGDYSADAYALRFPQFENSRDTGHGPWQLFELWVGAAKPAPATVDRWRGVFLQLGIEFAGRSAGSITPEEAQEWADNLVTAERSAITVHDVWAVAARTVFAWAVDRKHTKQNPFKTVLGLQGLLAEQPMKLANLVLQRHPRREGLLPTQSSGSSRRDSSRHFRLFVRYPPLHSMALRSHLLQQRLRFSQITRVEPLRKPPVHRSQ